MQLFSYFCAINKEEMRIKTLLYFIIASILVLCPAGAKAEFVVVIDPGHGGGDVGTPHRKCKQDEKTIALNVALKLGAQIQKEHPEVRIVYTRSTDVYPSLPDRTRIARESKGHLFISVHVNAALDSSAKGFETYVFGITGLQGKSESEQKRIRERTMAERENLDIDGNQIDFDNAVDIETKILCQAQREKHNKYSQEIAHYVQDNLMSALRRSDYRSSAYDRGVKQKNIFVLCYSPMPAILVELGYMSNAAEERFITTDAAQTLFANSIYKGFDQYYSNWRRRQLHEETADVPVVIEETAAATEEVKPQTQPKAQTQQPQPQAGRQKEAESAQPADVAYTDAAADGTVVPPLTHKECYRIQFLSSTKLLKKGDPALKGIWPVQCYQVGEYYRYTYGEEEEKAALQSQIQDIRMYFPDAFVVHFDANGKRI